MAKDWSSFQGFDPVPSDTASTRRATEIAAHMLVKLVIEATEAKKHADRVLFWTVVGAAGAVAAAAIGIATLVIAIIK